MARESNRSAEVLLDGYRLPPISESHLMVSPEAWNVLVDVDQLQADLAGSRTWERGADGIALRSVMHLTCATLSVRAADAGLESVSVRLVALGELLNDPVH